MNRASRSGQCMPFDSRCYERMLARLVASERGACDQAFRESDNRSLIASSAIVQNRLQLFQDARYNFGESGDNLLLIHSDIDRSIELKIAFAVPQLALEVEPQLVILKFRFGQSDSWGDAPFVWHLQPPHERRVPLEPMCGERSNLRIRLIGTKDGLVHVTRSIRLSASLTRALHSAIRAQAACPFDPIALIRTIASKRLSPSTAARPFVPRPHLQQPH